MTYRHLGLFCSAGGACMGYHRAGFETMGVDIAPQPNYPFEFHQADAFEFLAEHGHEFDFISASPMCRDHTPLTSVAGTTGTEWQLAAMREALIATGKPYVIENVITAPLRKDISIRICADTLGLRTVRHRRFEPGGGLVLTEPPWCHHQHRAPTATSRRRERWAQGWHVSVTGDVGTYVGPEAMGIDWMTGNELSQAIPPAMTEIIGRQILPQLEAFRVSA
jgi:DNA (cytosine-5)-methyltransferase 1